MATYVHYFILCALSSELKKIKMLKINKTLFSKDERKSN